MSTRPDQARRKPDGPFRRAPGAGPVATMPRPARRPRHVIAERVPAMDPPSSLRPTASTREDRATRADVDRRSCSDRTQAGRLGRRAHQRHNAHDISRHPFRRRADPAGRCSSRRSERSDHVDLLVGPARPRHRPRPRAVRRTRRLAHVLMRGSLGRSPPTCSGFVLDLRRSSARTDPHRRSSPRSDGRHGERLSRPLWAQRDSNPRHLPCKGSALTS